MKTKLYTFLLSSLLCTGALADNEPWQNPQVNEMNREPMHAHFTPFTNEANALKQRALPADVRFDVNPATERRITLDGTWKFLFQRTMTSAPKTSTSPDSVPASGVKLKFREAGNCKASMHLSIQIPVIRSRPIRPTCLLTTIP